MAPRNIETVIGRVAPILTANGVDSAGLKKIAKSAYFTAPECQRSFWIEAGEWLFRNLPALNQPETPAWANEVSDIWEGRRELAS